jgi:hypothetical protein
MKIIVLTLSVCLMFPVISIAETTVAQPETNCSKTKATTILPQKKKVVKKKPVREVAPPVVIREVVKEYVYVPATPSVVKDSPPIQVVEQDLLPVRRHHHVDASHPIDTDNLPYPPYNPYHGLGGGYGTQFGSLGTLGIGFGLGYGINH